MPVSLQCRRTYWRQNAQYFLSKWVTSTLQFLKRRRLGKKEIATKRVVISPQLSAHFLQSNMAQNLLDLETLLRALLENASNSGFV